MTILSFLPSSFHLKTKSSQQRQRSPFSSLHHTDKGNAKMVRTEPVHMALSLWSQTQQERIGGWVMFTLHCIPISAAPPLCLPWYEPHVEWGVKPRRPCTWASLTTGLFFFLYPQTLHRWAREPGELWRKLGKAAKSSLFSCLPRPRLWLNILCEECLESWFGKLILSESPSLKQITKYLTSDVNVTRLQLYIELSYYRDAIVNHVSATISCD